MAATPAFPSVDFPVSSVYATPAPSVDFPVSSSIYATVYPTSYFDCGGYNFTVTASSIGGLPTGVTTIYPSSSFISGPVPDSTVIASSGPVPGSTGVATATGSIQARNNWGSGTSVAAPSVAFPSASEATTITYVSASSIAIGPPSSGLVCPFPTSTAYASGPVGSATSIASSSRAAVSGTSGSQLNQQGGDTGAAIGRAVGTGSLAMGAITLLAQLL